MITIDMRMDFRNVKVRIFGSLAAFQHHWRANQLNSIRARREVSIDLLEQTGSGLGQRFIDNHQDFAGAIRRIASEDVAEHHVFWSEYVVGKMHAKFVTYLILMPQNRHK